MRMRRRDAQVRIGVHPAKLALERCEHAFLENEAWHASIEAHEGDGRGALGAREGEGSRAQPKVNASTLLVWVGHPHEVDADRRAGDVVDALAYIDADRWTLTPIARRTFENRKHRGGEERGHEWALPVAEADSSGSPRVPASFCK